MTMHPGRRFPAGITFDFIMRKIHTITQAKEAIS